MMFALTLGLGLSNGAYAQTAPKSDANFVALVIGLSSYGTLPSATELNFARSDAALVEKALREEANFTHTFLLTDGQATKSGIREKLRTDIAQLLGPDDVFVFYFVGHGIGADLDEPALLAHDSTVAAANEDGLAIPDLTADLNTFTKAGTTLIVTDAIHKNQLDGIYFFGPAANQWPTIRRNAMVISSSQSDSPAKDGGFGAAFAAGMAGAADQNADRRITAGELEAYLVTAVSAQGQIPVAAGDYDPLMVLSRGTTRASEKFETKNGAANINAQFGDVGIWSAKFVFREGASQTIHCNGQPAVKSCAPSCYVRDFKAGVCELSAVIDGEAVTSQVSVIAPGKYDCGVRAGYLSCRPPLEPAAPPKD